MTRIMDDSKVMNLSDREDYSDLSINKEVWRFEMALWEKMIRSILDMLNLHL